MSELQTRWLFSNGQAVHVVDTDQFEARALCGVPRKIGTTAVPDWKVDPADIEGTECKTCFATPLRESSET